MSGSFGGQGQVERISGPAFKGLWDGGSIASILRILSNVSTEMIAAASWMIGMTYRIEATFRSLFPYLMPRLQVPSITPPITPTKTKIPAISHIPTKTKNDSIQAGRELARGSLNVDETRQIDEEEFDGTEQDRKGEDIDFCEGDLRTEVSLVDFR